MGLLQFKRKTTEETVAQDLDAFLKGYSIEVMPRTAAKVENFRELLPEGTRVYIAHIEGTPIDEMVETAARLARDGYQVMPHFPARIIADAATLTDWIARYQGEAGVDQALLLAGGVKAPVGAFHSSMQLLETGVFDKAGFKRLHVAGHPEGNRDIDKDGTDKLVMEALHKRQVYCVAMYLFLWTATRSTHSPTSNVMWDHVLTLLLQWLLNVKTSRLKFLSHMKGWRSRTDLGTRWSRV